LRTDTADSILLCKAKFKTPDLQLKGLWMALNQEVAWDNYSRGQKSSFKNGNELFICLNRGFNL